MIINTELLDEISNKAKESERLRMNFNLHDSSDSKSQRLINALEVGTILPIHRHMHTSETYFLIRGKINVMFYNDNGEEIKSFSLDPLDGNYGIHIPIGQWHSLEVLENSSVIFEAKDGPYSPLNENDILK